MHLSQCYCLKETSPMMFQEPQSTRYDLRFRIFDVPVAVHPFFWIVGLVLVGTTALQPIKDDPSNALANLVLFMFVWFASILIHELGHSLVMRYYGIRSKIWLYAFGGLAIPDAFSSYGQRKFRWQQTLISLAGPMAQLFLYFVALICVIPMGYEIDFSFSISFFKAFPLNANFGNEESLLVVGPFSILKFLHVFWFVNWVLALFNLLPIFPLDGGHVTKEIMEQKFGYKGFEYTLWITIGTCILLGITAFQMKEQFIGIMMAILGFQAFQRLQSMRSGF